MRILRLILRCFVTPLCYPALLPRFVTPLCYPVLLPVPHSVPAHSAVAHWYLPINRPELIVMRFLLNPRARIPLVVPEEIFHGVVSHVEHVEHKVSSTSHAAATSPLPTNFLEEFHLKFIFVPLALPEYRFQSPDTITIALLALLHKLV
jgi:hypothetical protein